MDTLAIFDELAETLEDAWQQADIAWGVTLSVGGPLSGEALLIRERVHELEHDVLELKKRLRDKPQE